MIRDYSEEEKEENTEEESYLTFKKKNFTKLNHNKSSMIHFFYLMNRQGKTHISKYHIPYEDEEKELLNQKFRLFLIYCYIL
jgi:hypothetical protein